MYLVAFLSYRHCPLILDFIQFQFVRVAILFIWNSGHLELNLLLFVTKDQLYSWLSAAKTTLLDNKKPNQGRVKD